LLKLNMLLTFILLIYQGGIAPPKIVLAIS
jgi:hypothetical protein